MVMVAKLTTLTHKTAIQLHLVAEQFLLQVASPETFGYTLIAQTNRSPYFTFQNQDSNQWEKSSTFL